MRRSLWLKVLLITLVLAGAGALAPQRHALRAGRAVAAGWLSSRVAPVLPLARGPAGWGLGVAILAVLSGWTFALGIRPGRRDPLRLVLREVRGGRDAAYLARRTGLAQDALRLLLDPRAAGGRKRRRRETPSGTGGLVLDRATHPARGRAWRRCEDGA